MMAPFISFIFFTTLLLSLQTNARDSQFFSKVTHSNNNAKETELPNTQKPLTKPEEQQQQPVFIPETGNSYGLYGHDSSQFPSTTTTATNFEPYKTEFEDTSMYNKNNNNNYDNNDAYNNHQSEFNYNNYNKDAYEGYQNELGDTKYTEVGPYNSMRSQNNNYNNNYNNNHQMYHNNNHNNNNNNNNRYNNERQGMSDTRFVEGGKYFYDIKSEKNYNTMLHGEAYRGINNNDKKWYNNYGNQGNYNGNYQNQEEFEDEIDESEP